MNKSIGENAKDTDAILFLHGYLSSGASFYNQIKYFSKFFSVFAPDLKGFGENKGMEKAYTLDDYIDSVEEYKYKYSIKKPHIVAHSFGARIAIKAAALNEDFCDKLVLTGAAGLKPKPTLKKVVKKTAFKVLSKFVDKSKLSMFYSSDYNALEPIMKESFKLIVNEHLDEFLTKIQNQTLIIFGKNDKETPLYMSKRLNLGIKNSKLEIISNAGHFCFIDKPYAFNLKLSEFLFDS